MDIILLAIERIMSIQEIEILIKLVLIVILAGIVGFERESLNKPAGFRTHVLVGISAVLVMICGEYLYIETGMDPSRIPAQLLSGIGFLGAGTILRDGFNVKGLTTAASLLAITCIGLLIGEGAYIGGIIATAVVYAVLSYSYKLSTKLEHTDVLDLNISASNPKEILEDITKFAKDSNLEIHRVKIVSDRDNEYLRVIFKYNANLDKNEIISKIMQINKVEEVEEG